MGVELQKLVIAPPMTAYLDAYRACFGHGDLPRFGAALAGYELFSMVGSDFVGIALHVRYCVEDVGFWSAPIEDAEAYFWRMRTPLTELDADESAPVLAAMDRIEWHVGSRDELP